MSHLVLIEDNGELVDAVWHCSDACASEHPDYAGWHGCNENEFTEYCAGCGVVIPGLYDACEHQRDNVVVNRFKVETEERCEHGNLIQAVIS